MSQLRGPIPIVRIFDETLAREFYVDYLGFQVDWERRFEPGLPLYMQVSRDGCVLHLSEHHGDCCPGGSMRVTVEGLERFHTELMAKPYRKIRPGIDKTSFGTRDVKVSDPFGNRIIFTDTDDGADNKE